jgi:NADH:ubiquinone oxidoreductase subunit F (NADH-binding)
MKELLDSFPNVDYRKMLRVLEGLQTQGLIQETKVANLRGKGTVFYAALRADWLQSESVEHRAMVG